MRVYEVQPGDSPAGIASRDDMAGCPKCAIDLVRANPHKPTVTHPNGYVTFRELRAGERLNIPDKWFSKEFDELPPSYFAALPYADGITPGVSGPPYSAELVAAAERADAVLDKTLDTEDYCVAVARVGSPANSAVHDFKVLWNATQTPPVPINTGNYEEPTAAAMKAALGGRLVWEPCPPRAPAPKPAPVTRLAQKTDRISAGQVIGVALVGASAVAGTIYLVTR